MTSRHGDLTCANPFNRRNPWSIGIADAILQNRKNTDDTDPDDFDSGFEMTMSGKSNKNGKTFRASARPNRLDSSGLDLHRWNHHRWAIGFSAERDTDRWSRWAESLASRHGSVSRVGSKSSMILATPGVVERILKERWIGSINLYPTVKLAVRQILGVLPRSSDQTVAQLTHSNRFRSPDVPIYGNGPRTADSHEFQGSTATSKPGYTPFSRVFLRLNDADDFLGGRGRIAVAQEMVCAMTRRIIDNTQRVEQINARSALGSRSLVFKQTAPSTIATSEAESPDGFKVSRHGDSSLPRGLPEFDVSELTDQVIRQIDQRATAWRERMGRF